MTITDSFTFNVNDGLINSSTVAINININAASIVTRNDPLLPPYSNCAGFISVTGLDTNNSGVLDNSETITTQSSVYSNGTPITRNTLMTMIGAGNDVTSVNTCRITNMSSIFLNNTTFNQDISQWNTNSVTNMIGMFENAVAFNQEISQWDTSSVTDMSYMFYNAATFNQNLSVWSIRYVSNQSFFNTGSALTRSNLPGF